MRRTELGADVQQSQGLLADTQQVTGGWIVERAEGLYSSRGRWRSCPSTDRERRKRRRRGKRKGAKCRLAGRSAEPRSAEAGG